MVVEHCDLTISPADNSANPLEVISRSLPAGRFLGRLISANATRSIRSLPLSSGQKQTAQIASREPCFNWRSRDGCAGIPWTHTEVDICFPTSRKIELLSKQRRAELGHLGVNPQPGIIPKNLLPVPPCFWLHHHPICHHTWLDGLTHAPFPTHVITVRRC